MRVNLRAVPKHCFRDRKRTKCQVVFAVINQDILIILIDLNLQKIKNEFQF